MRSAFSSFPLVCHEKNVMILICTCKPHCLCGGRRSLCQLQKHGDETLLLFLAHFHFSHSSFLFFHVVSLLLATKSNGQSSQPEDNHHHDAWLHHYFVLLCSIFPGFGGEMKRSICTLKETWHWWWGCVSACVSVVGTNRHYVRDSFLWYFHSLKLRGWLRATLYVVWVGEDEG